MSYIVQKAAVMLEPAAKCAEQYSDIIPPHPSALTNLVGC